MKILLLSLKNYLKGLKFIFTPIGILSLFLITALSIAIPNIINSIKSLVDGVANIFSDPAVDWESAFTFLLATIAAEDWSQPVETFNKIISQDYLSNTLIASLQVLFPELSDDLSQVEVLVSSTIQTIFLMVAFIFLMVLLGFVIGHLVTEWFVKGSLRKRKIWQKIVFGLLDLIISVFVIWLVIKCFTIGPWGILLVFVILLSHAALYLFEAWLIYGYKKVKLFEIFNFKNYGFLLLSNLILIVIGVLITFLISLTKLYVVVFILALALFVVTHAVITANTEAYVAYVTDEGNMFKEDKKKQLKEEKKQNRRAKKQEKRVHE